MLNGTQAGTARSLAAAERGGSFGRNGQETRNWMRASAPGIAFRCHLAESSPVGIGERAARPDVARRSRASAITILLLLGVAGLAAFGRGLYGHTRAQPEEIGLRSAWSRSQATGAVVVPLPGAAAAQAEGT